MIPGFGFTRVGLPDRPCRQLPQEGEGASLKEYAVRARPSEAL